MIPGPATHAFDDAPPGIREFIQVYAPGVDDPLDELDDGIQPADAAARFQADHLVSPRGLTLRRYRGSWWRWEGRRYQEVSEEFLITQVLEYLVRHRARKKAKTTFVRDVLAVLKIDTLLPDALATPAWLSSAAPRETTCHVALSNGILDIEAALAGRADALQPHTPAFLSPVVLPYAFDPEATCPAWLAVLNRVMPIAAGQQLLQEYVGYCLLGGLDHPYGLILTGDGANGKSTVLKVVVKLLGRENCSAVALEKFDERFALFPMLGKLANIVNEMGEVEKTAEGILKNLISGEPMQFERKFKDPVVAEPTAKLIFACNTLPRFLDRSQGIWRRLLILPFDQVIDEAERDLDIDRKLEVELAGIFLWALAGLYTLRQRGHFVEPEISRSAKEELKLASNPARAFLVEFCRLEPAATVYRNVLYDKYREYCHDNGHRPLNANHFGAEVRRVFPEVQVLRPRGDRHRQRVWDGLALEGE